MNAKSIAEGLEKHTAKSGGGFMACCPAHDDNTPSLSIDEKGDKIVVNCFSGCSQESVISGLKDRGLWGSYKPQTYQLKSVSPEWKPITPVPVDAPTANTEHYKFGKPSIVSRYLSKSGDLLHLICRYDSEDGKQFSPLTFCSKGNNKKWRWQGLSQSRPLYGLETLGDARHVLICEGEKATEAARGILEGVIPVLSWSGGSNAVSKTDWSPLAGLGVTIWPDNDEPGFKAALSICKELNIVESKSIGVVDPPSDASKGWDLADAENEDWCSGQVMGKIKVSLSEIEFRELHSIDIKTDEPEAPLLFDDIPIPDIPASLLPDWLGKYADAVARNTQTPPAMSVMLALSTVATCIAKRFEVSPIVGKYREPLNIWTATALPPASRKSAVISLMTAPLNEWELSENKRLEPEINTNKRKRTLIEQKIKTLSSKGGNADIDQTLHSISALDAQLPKEIVPPKIWTTDATPERLQGLLTTHGERMAVLSDEGGIFEVMSGLYNAGKANIDIFLQGHNGGAVRVDRLERSAYLNSPALTFGLAIQPSILEDMGNGSKMKFKGNGTLARFLYAVPKSNVGYRNVRATHTIPEQISSDYRTRIFELLAIQPNIVEGVEKPRQLVLNPEALENYYAFSEMIEVRQGPNGDLEYMSDWSGKLPGAALRISGLFHIVKYGDNPPIEIEKETIVSALDLCELTIDHAKIAFNLMGDDPATADAKKIYEWVKTERLTQVKRSELYRKFRGRFTNNTKRLDSAIINLEQRKIFIATDERTSGRTAKVYISNPAIWKAS